MDKNYVINLLKVALEELEGEKENTIQTIQTILPTNTNLREKVVQTALKYLGGKYKYGGKDMDKIFTEGVDCSGFTQGVYKEAGIKVPNYACGSVQQREWGKETKNPQPGDLICYEGHVAIYKGNEEIINCGSTPIAIKKYNYRPIITMRNLIGD